MRLTSIVPHGDVPDRRGFAPAIVAQELARRNRILSPSIVCLSEEDGRLHDWWGSMEIRRYRVGRLYRRLFTKITRIDPWPLASRLAPKVHLLRPEVLHIHQLEFPLNALWRELGYRLPTAVHVHSMRTHDPSRGEADVYVAVSEYTRNIMCEERGFPEERVKVVHNGVDIDLFRPPSDEERKGLRDLLGIPGEALVIGYVGRRQEAKGYHDYLVMMERIIGSNDTVFGVVVGPEPADAKRDASHVASKTLLSRLVESGREISIPAVTHHHLRHLYRVMDLVVSISRGEQFPVMLVEAMASGCGVVATSVGGIPELVEHGRNGVLVDVNIEDDELVSVVSNLLDNAAFKNLGVAARSRVQERFSWNHLAMKMESILLDIWRKHEIQ